KTIQITGKAPDLKKLKAVFPVGLTVSVQFNGKSEIVEANVQVMLGVTGDAVGFSDGIIDNLNATLRASKKVGRADTKRSWFADIGVAIEFTLTYIRCRDYIYYLFKERM